MQAGMSWGAGQCQLQRGLLIRGDRQYAVLLTYIKYSKKCGINNYAALRNAESQNPGRVSQAIAFELPATLDQSLMS
jgi:hypothetical protein